MKRNRITALLLTAVMLNGMSACGSSGAEPETEDSGHAAASSEENGKSASEPDAEPDVQETAEQPVFSLADILAPTDPGYLTIPFVEEPRFTAGKQIFKITKDHSDETGGGVNYFEDYFFNEKNQLENYRVTEVAAGSLVFLETITYEYNEEGKPVSATHSFPQINYTDQKFFVKNIVAVQGIYKHSYPGYIEPISTASLSPAAAAQDNQPIEAVDEFDENGLKTQTTVTYLNGDTKVFTFQYANVSGGSNSVTPEAESENKPIGRRYEINIMDEAGNKYPIIDSYSYEARHGILKSTACYPRTTFLPMCDTNYTRNENGTIQYITVKTSEKLVCTYQFDENGNPTKGEFRKTQRPAASTTPAVTSAAPAVTSAAPAVTSAAPAASSATTIVTSIPPRDPSAPAVTTEPHSDLEDINMSDHPTAVLTYYYNYRDGSDTTGEE